MAASVDSAGWLGGVDELLRADVAIARGRGPLHGRGAIATVLVGGGLYGAVMGTFAFSGDRILLVVYGALKVPMLFGITMLLAIPAFYVMNAQRGVGADFRGVLRLLVEYQLRVVIILVALAPITALVNISNGVHGYGWVQFWNTFAFLLAALLAQRKLARAYAPLIDRDARHRMLLRAWTVLYAFVGIQMGWTLRPFIGQPDSAVVFVRTSGLDNAYVELFRLFGRVFGF